MKNQNVLLAAALLALGAASCQKEENVITQFTAGMEQTSAKTTLGDDKYFYWENTDVVKVYSDGANGSDFAVTPRADNGTWAVLSGSIAEGGSYTAIYPAGIAASATSVTLPAVQTSPDGSLAGFPMYAESSTDEFQFKNLCGALRIHLEQDNCTISSIKVTAASAINGIYDIYDTTGIPMLAHHDGSGTNTVTLTLGTAQPIGEGHDFYIYLPAGEYSDMQLIFYQPDGSYCIKSGSVTIERSVCTPVEITNSLAFIPEDCLHGLFSVSADKQVRFSKGNLQCTRFTEMDVWGFAEHQYNYFGVYGGASFWDLFYWSTTTTTFGMSTATGSTTCLGESVVDWGKAINPSGGDTPWVTLTIAEWTYLLGRSGKYGMATITNVENPSVATDVTGMVLIPDVWTCPQGLEFNSGDGPFANNRYTADAWERMEAAGAVFLPAAGYRSGNDIREVAEEGHYWSATPHATDQRFAYKLKFTNTGLDMNVKAGRVTGYSVRLVQEVQNN